MKKINFREAYIYIVIIGLAACIFLLSLSVNNIFPFGLKDLAIHDGIYQYKAFLFSFINSLKEGTIGSFSFLNGLGNPTIFNYLYYLASPFNLVAIFFNTPDMMYFSVIFVKVLITSLLALFYFRKKINNNIISIICSLSYTFSGWFLAYYFNIMWLDSFMVFPLLQYGLEELLNKNKCYVYIFSLAYIMLSNFYMAFMICIYIFIYYMVNIILKKDKYINKIKNFQLIMFTTIITCLLSSFTIYATYSSFLKMGIYINSINQDATYLTFGGIIKSFFCGNVSSNVSIYDEVIPNISVSIIFLISLLYYFVNDKIKLKQKLLTLLSFIFILFVICSKQMNFLINCFHMPVSFNFRYSFIISFYMLMLFVKNYKTFDYKIDKRIYLVCIVLFIILIVCYFRNIIDFSIFIFNLIFLINYTIWIIFYDKNIGHLYLLLIIVILELVLSLNMSFKNNNLSNISDMEYKNMNLLINRNSLKSEWEVNDNLYYNVSTIETFSSMQYNKVINFLDNMGCSTDLKATIFACNDNKVFSMLFNLDSKYMLSKVYGVKDDVKNYLTLTNDFVDNLNGLVLDLSGIDNIISEKNLYFKNSGETYYSTIEEDGEYIIKFNKNIKYIRINNQIFAYSLSDVPTKYLYFRNSKDGDKVEVVTNYADINVTTIKYIFSKAFYLNKNDSIEVVFNTEDKDVNIYMVDGEKLEQLYKVLKKKNMNYTFYDNSVIEGIITLDNGDIVFTTIPYDENWNVYIDGFKVETYSISNSLLAFDCPEGNHTIRLEYKDNVNISIIISILTFIGLILNLLFRKRR